MLGPAKPRRLDEPIAVSLEELVPANNFYRFLEAKLDLSFVRRWVQELYAERGRPSIDPVVFFKLQLIMFFEGIRSERQLMQVVADWLSLRWYRGYDLSEPMPDHSSLSRIRERYGLDVFRRFFGAIVEQCLAAGLVWGRELYVDATKVAANADVDSLVPRFYHEAETHVADLFAADPAPVEHDDAPAEPPPGAEAAAPEGAVQLSLAVLSTASLPKQAPRRKLLEERRLDPHRPAVGSYRRTTDFRAGTTDPDAMPMRTGTATALGYHDHYEEEVVYRADAAICNACPVKAECTKSDRGRMVHRSFYEQCLDTVRGYHETEAYQKAMRKRKVWVEPLFAEAKQWHGLRRFRRRGLENVNTEGLLIAAGQNLKRFLVGRGWGRRPFPSGAAGVVLPALPPLRILAP